MGLLENGGIKRKIESFENYMNDLENGLEKYLTEGYILKNNSEIIYQDPENDEQIAKARKSIRNNMTISIIVFVALVATLIGMIITGTSIGWVIFMAIFVAIIGYVIYKDRPGKQIQIMKGKAIHKYRRRLQTASGSISQNYNYFVTVIPDNEEKTIYRDLQVSKADYELIENGTPIMVVKGGKACIL